MKNATTYRIILSDGSRADLPSTSASQAMQSALEKHPGLKIIKCWSGSYEPQVSMIDGIQVKLPPAYIEYDIPNHEPHIRTAKVKQKDDTIPMFNDAEISSKSDKSQGIYAR